MTTVPLEEVAEWGSGGTPKRGVDEYFGSGTPWLSIADLNDGVVNEAKESLTAAGLANSSAKIVPPGTILIAMYGSIGKLGVTAREMCTSQAIAFAKPRTHLIEPRYLFHYLLAQRRAFQALGRGGTQMNIGQGDLKRFPIPLPSLEEQGRIAAILDHADALRSKRRQVLAHLDALTQSIFHDLFGDPQTWPQRWSMGTIGDMTSSVQYGTSAKAGPEGQWAMLRMGNVTDDGRLDLNALKYVDLTDSEIPKYTTRLGDLLFNRTNSKEKVGKAAVVRTSEPLAIAGYLVRARFKPDHRSEFVSAYLRSPHGQAVRRRLAKAAVNQANINATEMRRIVIAHPPEFVQEAFVSTLSEVETLREQVEGSLSIADELFASLQSRLFKGEL